MIPDAIKSRLNNAPFKPFELRLTSGVKYVVPHPEMVSLSPGGRQMILWIIDNAYVDIDVLLVESITQADGRGPRRRKSA
jgi:hypothetical protein